MSRGRNKANATGRSMTSRFARLDHRLLESSAYRALSPNARALLVEFTRMDNGSNNGALWLSVRDAAAHMGVANTKTASVTLSELQDMGFIGMTKDAHFRVKAADTSRARYWRLTWLPIPREQGPTNDYQQREPSTKLARSRMETGLRALKSYKRMASQNQIAVGELHTLALNPAGNAPLAVCDSYTAKPLSDVFPPKLSVVDLTTHTAVPWGRDCRRSFSLAWWQSNGLGPFIASMAAIDAAARFNQQSKHVRLAA
jgi:hypothetical protein